MLMQLATAEPPSVSPPPHDALALLPSEEAQRVLQWAADWVSKALPSTYHGDKDWGKQTRLYAGVRFTKHDGRLSTKRRWVEVGHGRWIQYDIDLHDPALPDRLNIQITKAEIGPDHRIHFEAQIDTRVDLHIQQERWNLGTRLFSVSVKGDAAIRMIVVGDVGFAFDLTRIPPDVVADPNIRSTQVSLVSLNIDRVSKIGGEVAEAFGDVAKRIIRDEYLPKQQAKITDRLNTQIDRRRDQFRFGASEWLLKTLPTTPTK
ncbi:MAG TPA: hypothetical protein DDZ51_00025 [Planctomycetaceae bacterium]|nr:hypothetical protein [Planctomycetaceae bacterium]